MTFDRLRPVDLTPVEMALAIGALRTSRTKFVEAGEWETVDEINTILDRLHDASGMPVPAVEL